MMMIAGGNVLRRECVTVNDNYSQYFSSGLTTAGSGLLGAKTDKNFLKRLSKF